MILLYYLRTVRPEFNPVVWNIVFWVNALGVAALAVHFILNWRWLTKGERWRLFIFMLWL